MGGGSIGDGFLETLELDMSGRDGRSEGFLETLGLERPELWCITKKKGGRDGILGNPGA